MSKSTRLTRQDNAIVQRLQQLRAKAILAKPRPGAALVRWLRAGTVSESQRRRGPQSVRRKSAFRDYAMAYLPSPAGQGRAPATLPAPSSWIHISTRLPSTGRRDSSEFMMQSQWVRDGSCQVARFDRLTQDGVQLFWSRRAGITEVDLVVSTTWTRSMVSDGLMQRH